MMLAKLDAELVTYMYLDSHENEVARSPGFLVRNFLEKDAICTPKL